MKFKQTLSLAAIAFCAVSAAHADAIEASSAIEGGNFQLVIMNTTDQPFQVGIIQMLEDAKNGNESRVLNTIQSNSVVAPGQKTTITIAAIQSVQQQFGISPKDFPIICAGNIEQCSRSNSEFRSSGIGINIEAIQGNIKYQTLTSIPVTFVRMLDPKSTFD